MTCFDLTFSMAGDPTQWGRFYEGKWGGPTYVVSYLDPAHMA